MLTAGNAHALTWILSTASAMDLERRRVSPQLQTRKKLWVSLADLNKTNGGSPEASNLRNARHRIHRKNARRRPWKRTREESGERTARTKTKRAHSKPLTSFSPPPTSQGPPRVGRKRKRKEHRGFCRAINLRNALADPMRPLRHAWKALMSPMRTKPGIHRLLPGMPPLRFSLGKPTVRPLQSRDRTRTRRRLPLRELLPLRRRRRSSDKDI